MENNKQVKNTIKIFLVWFLGIFSLGAMATAILPFKPRFPYAFDILAKFSPYQIIWQWANFDGPHYITIAQKGYVGTGLIQAYFPLYPYLIRYINLIINNYLVSGLLLSITCFILGIYYFQKLLSLEGFKNKLPLLYLLLFPTSFYFISLYTESLFLLLTLLFFINLKKKQWFMAAFWAGVASACRLVGIFLAPLLIITFLKKNKNSNKSASFKIIFCGILSLSGFILFCWYLNKEFGNPFYFTQVQSQFGASRQTDKIVLLYQVIWRYIKMIVTMRKNDILFYTILQEFVISLFTLSLLIFATIKKKLRKSYLIYSYLSFFLPTLTGNFSSMPRYVLLIFPIYFVLGQIKNRLIQHLILLISGILLIINTMLFVRGYWVA